MNTARLPGYGPSWLGHAETGGLRPDESSPKSAGFYECDDIVNILKVLLLGLASVD